MAISQRLKGWLEENGLDYELVHHARSATSLESARAAHVPAGKLAKSVLLEDGQGYLLAVLPASCHLDLARIEEQLHRKLELASEEELADLFADCEPGAIPAAGPLYGLPTLVDDALLRMPDVYLEGGDHEELVHLSGEAFREIASPAMHGRFARPH